ncbi:uncharacterized protein [Primulina huaijiensis]|uniref:uncharacterized protein n=1 Tax=Primulina huaijiensis TaxID=1492673 RepID=UPI003CC70A22
MKTRLNTPDPNFLQFPFSDGTRRQNHSATPRASSSPPENIEIRVCTNRTCRKQGSLDVLQVLSGIAPPSVAVNSCGCLGKCGLGPNIVILPEGILVGHCGTPKKAANTMSYVCGICDDEVENGAIKCLEALALRKRAEAEMERGDFSQANTLLTQAIDFKPFGGAHTLYKNRSAARLAMGDVSGALEDAKKASTLAPHYPQAYICEGDVFMAMDRFDAAEESYSIALELDPSIRRSKSFKAKIAKLQEKLSPANSG